MEDPTPYLAGLRLDGRRVVVVGGGQVAQRRIPTLLGSGAEVLVVSPDVSPAIEGMVGAGEVTWRKAEFEPADLDEAWYALAVTSDPDVNAAVLAAAEERRIFCVRADDASRATAWTPATGRHDGLSVAVLGNREPRRSAAVRDAVLEGLREGAIADRARGRTAPGVTLVGGGPGDPDLITVAGRKALMAADVVVADRLAPRELLADLPADVEIVDVAKLPRGRSASQVAINELIVERARAGQRVARFKGGDSFVFGRGYEEVIACREAGVPVTIIPGLTSPVTVPGLAGIPVTHRGVTHSFSVVSGHLPPGHPESLVSWPALAQAGGTLVLLMAVENAAAIADALVDGGLAPETPVAVVCDGSMPTERTVDATLGTLAEVIGSAAVRPPAIIVVGEVVRVARG